MNNEKKFDDRNIIAIRDIIYERYPEAKKRINSTYNSELSEDKEESLFICLSALFFGLHSRDKYNLNKNTQYNNHILDSKLLTDSDFDILKINASGTSLKLIRRTLIINMLNIILELSFWDKFDYILNFVNLDNEDVNYIYENFLFEPGLDFNNYKNAIFFKSIKFFLDGGKLERAHELVVKNEKIINELMSQTTKIKNLKRDVERLEKTLNGTEQTLQTFILKDSFVRIKNSILSQLIDANKKYLLSMIITIITPLFFLFLSFVIHTIIPFIMNAYKYEKIKDYTDSVQFSLENMIFYSLPILAFEVVLFYFSRVMYAELKSLKAQMIQIEHRIASCEFIRSYMKQKDEYLDRIIKLSHNDTAKKLFGEGGLDKFVGFPSDFEKLIFNPIQMSGENIPAVLDGVNSIAELAGKVMSAKNPG